MFRFPRLKQPRPTAHFAPLAPTALPWRIDATPSGGGDFLDLASPALDRCELFSGPLQGDAGRAARLTAGSSPIEDTVAYTFYTATGVPGTGRWNFAPPSPRTACKSPASTAASKSPFSATNPPPCALE